ncbi:MAG: ATP-binding protein [Thermodesulfobacteriota bacterium]|nr:ATP-binding protein [Thermodesulfobacteriota bacterium]
MSATKEKAKATENRVAFLQDGYQAILEFIDKMESLIQFQDKVDTPSSISQIWRVFLANIRNLIKIEVCALFLVEEKTNEFFLKDVSPQDKEPICQKEIDFQIECGAFSWIMNRRQPAIIPSLAFKDRKTVILLPLCTTKRTLGVVLVLTPIEESSVTQENLKLLTMLAKQCSLLMENTVLYENLRDEHESLQKAQTRILQAEKLASVGRLTAGASHEILNPLNIISGNIQLLLMDEDLSPGISEHLEVMRGQTERISRIVKGLLQFSQHPKPASGEVDVNELIENVLSLSGHEAESNNIKIIRNFSLDLPSIRGDDRGLTQVLFNILSNARDAMPNGGRLRISTCLLSDNGQLSGESDLIEIKFQDTGGGIVDEHIDKIFDPFFTTKESGERAGLGLSISYGIIQDHGGTISAKSNVDQGTELTVRLPAIQ